MVIDLPCRLGRAARWLSSQNQQGRFCKPGALQWCTPQICTTPAALPGARRAVQACQVGGRQVPKYLSHHCCPLWSISINRKLESGAGARTQAQVLQHGTGVSLFGILTARLNAHSLNNHFLSTGCQFGSTLYGSMDRVGPELRWALLLLYFFSLCKDLPHCPKKKNPWDQILRPNPNYLIPGKYPCVTDNGLLAGFCKPKGRI